MHQAGQHYGTEVHPIDSFESLLELMCYVDQKFFAAGCRWLGNYFAAGEVRLHSSLVCRSNVSVRQPWLPETAVASWQNAAFTEELTESPDLPEYR